MSKFNYLELDSRYWKDIVNVQTNRKRNFQSFDTELLYVAKSFLNSYNSQVNNTNIEIIHNERRK